MQHHLTTPHSQVKEILSTVTSKGQVTLPKDVRAHLGVAQHDQIAFVIEADGQVQVRTPQYPSVASLAGAAGSLDHSLDWSQMRTIARDDRLAHRAKERSGGSPSPASL